MIENRKFPRYNKRLEVRYSKIGIAPIESCTITKNVSRTGVGLRLTRLVKKGDTLKLEFYPPATQNPPIQAIGKVIWTHEGGQFDLDAGLEFTRINPADAGKLVAVV